MTDRPQTIDCQEALDRLYEYLDGELTEIRALEVREHLKTCAPCMAISGFESSFLRFLEARTRVQRAPEELRKRILQEIVFDADDE